MSGHMPGKGYISDSDSQKINTVAWREYINNAPRFSQRQDSMQEQLHDLYFVANKLGFYDAADFLKSQI